MLELQTFGTVGLRAREGGDSVAQLIQPKRLALVIYLALAPPRRCRRRDQIVALLWPDLDEEHARGALSQALRYLRRALGDEILLTQGDEEVAVSGAHLWCDATAFGACCETGNFARALELYRGPFLNAFHADASPEFERWVEQERAGFSDRASRAARRLCEAAEERGDLLAAVQYAKQAAAVSPDNEAAVANLIRLLDRSGDRVGALRTYQELRRRLEEEFGASPSLQTETIMAEIRRH